MKLNEFMQHAEKKAFVALLEANSDAPTMEIAINFRVCADCHSFLKAASTMIGPRTIVVREPRLTHVMERGDCSCAGCPEVHEACEG